MTVWGAAVFITFCSAWSPAPAAESPPPDSLAVAIQKALQESRQNPRSGHVRVVLAEAYLERGNLVAARASAEEGLRLGLSGEDSTRAILALAKIALSQGRRNEARARLDLLANRGSASPGCLAILAQMSWDDHQREDALALGMAAAGRDPGDPDRIRWLAERWKETGRPEMALNLRRGLVARGIASEEDLFQVGFLSQQLGNGQAAADSYLRLLALSPSHPQGNYNLSLLLLSAGDTLEATRRLEAALSGTTKLARAYLDLALLYMGRRQVADAKRVLNLFRVEAGADSAVVAEVEEILHSLEGQ